MKAYRHDTYYYGGDILNTINEVLECTPSMDRGGKYVWCDSIGERIVYCDLRENNNFGCLEVYENGQFLSQIDYRGILELSSDLNDLVFHKEKVISYLSKYTSR